MSEDFPGVVKGFPEINEDLLGVTLGGSQN